MSLSPMSHVEFKKWPCRPVDFRGQWPCTCQGTSRDWMRCTGSLRYSSGRGLIEDSSDQPSDCRGTGSKDPFEGQDAGRWALGSEWARTASGDDPGRGDKLGESPGAVGCHVSQVASVDLATGQRSEAGRAPAPPVPARAPLTSISNYWGRGRLG